MQRVEVELGSTMSTIQNFGILQYFCAFLDYTMDEHRKAPRHRTLKAGKIEFGLPAIDCVVRNISKIGAALEVESPIGVPDRFDLVLPSDGVRKSANVVWRKPNRIGIRFE